MNTATRATRLIAVSSLLLASLACHGAAAPSVSFSSPGNGQAISSFAGISGTAQANSGNLAEVVFSIRDQSNNQWWNGSAFQGTAAWLPTEMAGSGWSPANSVVLPAVSCSHSYELSAKATDTETNSTTITITVQADSQAPTISFTTPAEGQVVPDLTSIGGNVSDNLTSLSKVGVAIRELDINGGQGRWWNGTNFQGSSTELTAVVSGGNWSLPTGAVLPSLNSGQSYEITATATDSTCNSGSSHVTVRAAIADLAWDPGQTASGTAVLQNPNTNGGCYWFKIVPQSPRVGAWRTALRVEAGEADVYMSRSSPPTIYSSNYASQRVGSDGFVLEASQFDAAQDWYILVRATPNASWKLLSGDIFVYDLGALATDASNGTNAQIEAEGTVFLKTTIGPQTRAWRLWLEGATNTMLIRKSLAPHPVAYDLIQSGQMLVVPPYLAAGTFNGSYFIGVIGEPGTLINLDSREQTVTDLAFNTVTSVNVAAGDYPYRTFRVSVPVEQIAWQLNLTPTSGAPHVAVRRDLVPNEFRNDAFSETPDGVGASVTLVPARPDSGPDAPGLSDGTFFVTVYSTGPFSCGFNNSNPVVTDVHYLFEVTNDVPTRAGWRYYRVPNIPEQLGSLGWELTLANQVPGSEIAIRRNAVPGRWIKRTTDNQLWTDSLGYVDYSGTGGFLQRPGHQADVWYIGVYTPAAALGEFVLRGKLLTSQLSSFDSPSGVSITDEPAGHWRFFRVDVPADAVGWDLRLVGVNQGSPKMVVSRDTLPSSFETTPWAWWQPMAATDWSSGYQWANYGWDSQWTGCGSVPMFAMGMGNPLRAGTYYIGIKDPSSTSSYTVLSRGIGGSYTIPVRDLGYAAGSHTGTLAVAEGDYFRVTLPAGLPDWKLKLRATSGELLLKVQKDYLPHSGNYGGYGAVYGAQGGQPAIKAGDEQWALMPENGNNNVTAGTYYAVVVSQGQDPTNQCRGPGTGWGGGSASYELSSMVEAPAVLPGVLSYGNDLLFTNAQQGGEIKFYRFNVPAGIASVEVRLENRVGNPVLYMNQGPVISGTRDINWSQRDSYGNFGGTNHFWRDANLITVPNAQPGSYSLSIMASAQSGDYPDAAYVLRVRAPIIPSLNISAELNTNGQVNVSSGVLADNQRAFYEVNVPAAVNGAPVLGWKLDLTALNGSPAVRVRKNFLPEEGTFTGTSLFSTPTAIIAPAYLSPGKWYVEVKGGGATTYNLTSTAITTNSLTHPVWVMPGLGETNIAAGLTLPSIGDSGIDSSGNALPGDQGIDLEQGRFHCYAVYVPTNNAGLLRTELQAINGNPNLYLRVGAAPSLAHYTMGAYGDAVYDRSLTGNTTEYGNWVPLNGRYESRLAPGIWVLAVQAGGNANARYRLQLSCGNPVADGRVQDLALEEGSFSEQHLNGGDWRYYRVQIPSNAPANWVVNWTRSLGSARMFVRDTLPPGDGYRTRDYSDANYNPIADQWHGDLQTWNTDGKNQGPYPRFDAPGAYSLGTPPLRPGNFYYLGFWSPSDTTFSVSSSTSGGVVVVTNAVDFYGGAFSTVLPPHGSQVYRLDVPAGASRLMVNAQNSANVIVSVEQGTLARPGGPAHWTSFAYLGGPNQANARLDVSLLPPSAWPWLSGCTYYLALTNTSDVEETAGAALATPTDLVPFSFIAPASVVSTQQLPTVSVVWGVENRGTTAASNGWHDRVWFSTNGILDSQSIALGDFWNDKTVVPGGRYYQTNTVTLPMTQSGNYWLFVQVDYQNRLPEPDKANNLSSASAGTFSLTLPQPTLGFALAPEGLKFDWTGPYVLQSATNAAGPYEDVPGATSPYGPPVLPEPQRFFRLRGP